MTFRARVLPPLALAAILFAVPGAVSASSQAGNGSSTGVSIASATAGYQFNGGGNYRLNGPSSIRPGGVWVPLHVVLVNNGSGDATARLAVSDNGPQNNNNGNGPNYRTDYTLNNLSLGAGAKKAFTLYMRASSIGSQVTISLDVGSHTIDTRSLSPSTQNGGALSVGVLSDDTGAPAALRQLKFGDTALSVAQFDDNTAPLDTEAQALENFDLIVLSNYTSDTLSGAQKAALEAWVQEGGALLVAGGPDAGKTMGGLPSDLLPATLRSSTTASSLPELATVAGDTVATNAPVVLSVASPASGATVIASHNGVPLLIDRPYGRGHLVYSALEPTQQPFSAWTPAQQSDYWSHALSTALAGPLDALVESSAQSGPGVWIQNSQTSNFLQDLGVRYSGNLPALQIYIFLIVLYVLVLGPGNYLFLRWRRRLEWSWITIPAAAIVFGVGSFGLAYARNGSDVQSNVATVVYLDPGTAQRTADSYIGILAPFQGDYTLSTPGAALIWGLGGDNGTVSGSFGGQAPLGMSVDEAAPLTAHLVGLQLWGQRNVAIQQRIDLRGDVTGHLTIANGTVSGEITNGTRMTLRDCAVAASGGASSIISRIRPGQTVHLKPFHLNSGAIYGSSNGGVLNTLYSQVIDAGTGRVAAGRLATGPETLAPTGRYNNMLSAIFPNGSATAPNAPLTFIGWSNLPLAPFSVNGSGTRRSDLDMIVAPLQATLAPGRFAVQPGDLQVSVVDTTVSQNTGASGLTLNAGDNVDVQLALPTGGRPVSADTMTLSVNSSTGAGSLTPTSVALWDWTARRWVTKDASSGTATVSHAAPFLSPDGRVLLRVQASAQSSDLTFNNVDQNVQIGVTGRVR